MNAFQQSWAMLEGQYDKQERSHEGRSPESDFPAVGDFHVAHQDACSSPAQCGADHQGDALAMLRRRAHQGRLSNITLTAEDAEDAEEKQNNGKNSRWSAGHRLL